MPKVYINDLGLKNIIETQGFILRETGSMVENFVYNELKIKLKEKLKFWRTQTKAEVDFIIDQGNSVIPIEVKYTERKPDITGGLLSFYKKYQPQRILMITKDYFLTESYETAIIEYVPVYALNRISIFK